MKKKGFTLVELLATIVVLSVIALIAVPIVINVIEKAKKSALVSSVNGLVESANMYYTNEIIKGDISDNVIFDFEEGVQTSDNKLSYKGKVYNGKLILTSDSEITTCIDDGKYYAYKERNSDEIVSGIGTCVYDGTTGNFTIESDIDVIQKECASDKQELQDKIEELTDNVNNLETLINEKEYEISNLQSTIDNLNNELITLRGEKEELQNQLALSNTSNTELQEKINELNGKIAELQSSIEAKNNEITVLNGEKTDLQTALDTKTAELATLNENLGKVTATASDVLSGTTILTSSGLVTGTMPNKAGTTVGLSGYETVSIKPHPSDNSQGLVTITNQYLSYGYFDSTTKFQTNIANLNSANIKAGVAVGQVNGNSSNSIVGTFTSDANAAAGNILSGKTAYVNGNKITGTMANKSGATVAATTVTESGTNALITIPSSGYYSTSSKISVPIETIKNEVNVSNVSSGNLPISTGQTSAVTQTVNVGFKPTLVLVYTVNQYGDKRWQMYSSILNTSKSVEINNSGQQYGGNSSITITETGFTVSAVAYSVGQYHCSK